MRVKPLRYRVLLHFHRLRLGRGGFGGGQVFDRAARLRDLGHRLFERREALLQLLADCRAPFRASRRPARPGTKRRSRSRRRARGGAKRANQRGNFYLRQSAHDRAEEVAQEEREHEREEERPQKIDRVKNREQKKPGQRDRAHIERPLQQIVHPQPRRHDRVLGRISGVVGAGGFFFEFDFHCVDESSAAKDLRVHCVGFGSAKNFRWLTSASIAPLSSPDAVCFLTCPARTRDRLRGTFPAGRSRARAGAAQPGGLRAFAGSLDARRFYFAGREICRGARATEAVRAGTSAAHFRARTEDGESG